jgi:hypothetical protein
MAWHNMYRRDQAPSAARSIAAFVWSEMKGFAGAQPDRAIGDYIGCSRAALAACASAGHAAGARARAAASAVGRLRSQSRAMKRQALMPSDWDEASYTTGTAMISGSSRMGCRGLPGGKKPGVSVGPPGTRMFTVTPVPSRSLAKLAQLASSAVLEAP